MSAETVYGVNAPRVAHETIDGETILIDFESGAYYSIRGTGPFIWSLLSGGTTAAKIEEVLARRYPEAREALPAALEAFLAELEREELVARLPENAHPSDPSPSPADEKDLLSREEGLAFSPPILEKYTDMQDLLLLDPIHEVGEEGWPMRKPPAR